MWQGIVLRVTVVAIRFIVTLFSGWNVTFVDCNSALLFSALLTAVTTLEALFLFNRKFRIYYDNITRLSIIDTNISMLFATSSYTEDQYNKWFEEYTAIQESFHENRIDIIKTAENIGM
ncbi:hypothetical protein J23TS9_46970 [Paenibacillus sp. J23TS9]|nr:hypothetical protein J23TS9_46970 [Paenibacillus sp. J23TS9]